MLNILLGDFWRQGALLKMEWNIIRLLFWSYCNNNHWEHFYLMSLISIAKVEGEKVKMCKHGLTKYYEADKKCWVAGWTDWKWARRRGRKDHSCHTICPWAYEWLSEAFGARMYNQNFLLCNGKLICNRQLKEDKAKS